MPDTTKNELAQHSLSAKAARSLATTTKTTPMMEEISPRWILNLLPWVQVESGTYRVNRRKIVLRRGRKIETIEEKGKISVRPESLQAMCIFQDIDVSLLKEIASRFASKHYHSGQTILKQGEKGNQFYIVAQGKAEVSTTDTYGRKVHLAILSDDDDVRISVSDMAGSSINPMR